MLPFAPYISDGIGRRKTLSIGAFIIAGGAVLQALSSNVIHFIASRGLSTSSSLGVPISHQFFNSWTRDHSYHKCCTRSGIRARLPNSTGFDHRALQYALVLWVDHLRLGVLCYAENIGKYGLDVACSVLIADFSRCLDGRGCSVHPRESSVRVSP